MRVSHGMRVPFERSNNQLINTNIFCMKDNVFIRETDWPEYSQATPPGEPSLNELNARIHHCLEMMQERGLSHLVVYSDREHFANLMYLTHFDPRFEEALLILTHDKLPLILVGNECVGHLNISPLYRAGELRYERYQTFSLMNQPRNQSRRLEVILAEEGIAMGAKVGCVGWKYYSSTAFDNPELTSDIPAYLIDRLRKMVTETAVVNATDLFISPSYGMRSFCSAYEIACFEFSNVMASEGMTSLLKNFKADITDFDQIKSYQYTGYPLNCHIGIKSSGNQHYGLSSPVGAIIRKGDPCSTNIGYWGSNICRAGWVAENEDDLPETAKGYVENFAGPYFAALRDWFKHLKIGTTGGELQQIIDDRLPFDQFGVFLNPGHLIHWDEWTSSPIYKGSTERICPGMYIQTDIIPRSARYFSSRMEDGIVIADEDLCRQLKKNYPDMFVRCMKRREFMEQLGFELPNEVLPLSNTAGIVPPFFLNHKLILSFI